MSKNTLAAIYVLIMQIGGMILMKTFLRSGSQAPFTTLFAGAFLFHFSIFLLFCGIRYLYLRFREKKIIDRANIADFLNTTAVRTFYCWAAFWILLIADRLMP